MPLLENNTIKLRALEPEDLALLYQWENNTEWWQVGNTINPYSKYILREYIVNSDKSIYENKQLRLMITIKENAQTIGMIDLYDFDPHHQRAGVGIVVDNPFQQKGYAAKALELLKVYAFEHLHVKVLYAHILPENKSSVSLFEKHGFEQTGVLKSWLRQQDNYIDVFVFQLVNK